MIEALAHAGIPTIPVRVWYEDRWRKQPLEKWDDATTDCETLARWQRQWPEARPGIPLARVGWCAIDLDDYSDPSFREAWVKPERVVSRRGRRVLEAEHYSIYATPSGGRHIVFAQPDPPVAGRMRWGAGVEVLGIGTLLTVYDAHAILYPRVAQRAVLPEVFRKPYAARGTTGTPINKPRCVEPPEAPVAVDVAEVVEALFALDPHEWHGEHDAWLALANAAKFEGVGEDDFVAWSLGDEWYRRDERLIRRKWHSLSPTHGGALWAALAARNIKVTKRGMSPARSASLIDGGSDGPTATPTVNLQRRTDGLFAHLAQSPTDDRLFTVAATFGEIILEGRIQRWVANDLLEGACRANGLWKSLGPDRCRRTIANGYRHVEEKYT